MERSYRKTLNLKTWGRQRCQTTKVLQKGRTQQGVADELEVSRTRVNGWWKRFQEGGWEALRAQKRGPKKRSRKLTVEQEEEVQRLIADKTPDQLKLKFALWTREAVARLIEERYGVVYSLQSVSVILKRWGFSPQRPLKRAYEQRPAGVQQRMRET